MTDDPLIQPPPDGIERRSVREAPRLLLGGPVVLVTSSWRGRHNVMPLAWHMPLSSDPPLIGISVEQSRHSAEMIAHAQAFVLNFPTRAMVHHVQYLGSMRGEDVDKFEATQLETFSPAHVTAPLIAGCAAWIECEVQEVVPLGDHLLFAGLPVAVHVDPEAFRERWLIGGTHEDHQPLHFLGGHEYSTLRGVIEARLPRDFEAPERVLRERLAEELEITREARERREERLGELERDVERGNVVDVSQLGTDPGVVDDPAIDLGRGLVLGGEG